MLGARAHVAYCRGQLGDLAERTRRGYGALPPLTGAHLSVYMNVGYEVVARIAFFAADRESLEWAAAAVKATGSGGGRVQRRMAAIAAAHVSLFDGPRADPSIREAIDSTLRQRVQGSAIGRGFMQRETPYLSVAAADVEWIASERAAIEQFVDGGNDVRVVCFMHMLDAVLALYDGDDERATRHWHDLLAISSERDFGLLWIDALEGIAIGAARAGAQRRGRAPVGSRRDSTRAALLSLSIPPPRRAAERIGRRPRLVVGGGHVVRTSSTRRTGAPGERVGGAHTDRGRSRQRRRRRADQPAGRGAVVHERSDGEDPPAAHLRQARDQQPRPARRRGGRSQPLSRVRVHPRSSRASSDRSM